MTLRRFRTVTTLLAGLAVASAIFAGGISPTPSSAAPTNATEANSVQLTFGTHYDRNSTTLKAADGTYWMYFARSVEPCDRAVQPLRRRKREREERRGPQCRQPGNAAGQS